MREVVKIPPIAKEARIGQAFNELFHVIDLTEKVSPFDNVVWEFDQSSFYHPFFICSLSLYKQRSGKTIEINSPISAVSSYLNMISFDNPVEINDHKSISLIDAYVDKSYIPICRFRNDGDIVEEITAELQNRIIRQNNLSGNIRSALSYLIGELAANIQDHSQSQYGYMFCQYLRSEGCLNLCIADEGLTIHGSFVRSGKFANEELLDEGMVLNKALGYASTKNLPNAENRGFGLPTSKRMLAEGLKGAFFILSGNSFHRHDSVNFITATLPETIRWDGTIILMKIPIIPPKDFNYLNFIER